MPRALREPSFGVLLGLAWLAVGVHLLLQYWGQTAVLLFDTDDAMRLVSVRALLAGQGWFDLHEARVAPPLGYLGHWSRLIDAGIAGLILLFHPFAGPELAERLARAAWPLLWLLPTMGGIAAIAWRTGRREAALITLLFVLIGLPAFHQYTPGRIDHHGVQIALTVLTVAAVAWSDRRAWAAPAAGLASALALAIGFECAPFIVLCGAALAARFVLDPSAAGALRRYGIALAAGGTAAFLVSVGPDRWTQTACDAIAINTALPLTVAGVLLAAAAAVTAGRGLPARLAALGIAGGAAVLLFAVLEPRCLRGPFAMVDPAVWPIWLDHVKEMQPALALLRRDPTTAAVMLTFPAIGLAAGLLLLRVPELRRDFAYLVALAVLALACAITLAAVKTYSYAMLLAMPLVALGVLRATARPWLDSLVVRAFVAILVTPGVVSSAAVAAVEAVGSSPAPAAQEPGAGPCFKSDSYAQLARLPKGLVATDIDYGPFLLALTSHSALAAPYHRQSAAIIAAHDIFAAAPDAARRLVVRFGVDYVAVCKGNVPVGPKDALRKGSLRVLLEAGRTPAWLVPITATDGPFAVYRVRLDP
ncbi:MAG: hypothetical protein C3F17_08995 [Bradyrhizobiaceae bacterium]|nr:MAG: hypothetical protein C3F17_08995 [Bradyrhizobiaceae bacterium]